VNYIYVLVFIYMAYVVLFLKLTPMHKLDAMAEIIHSCNFRLWVKEWPSTLKMLSLLPAVVAICPMFIVGLLLVVTLEFWLHHRYMSRRN
jgi:hypothetical protein